MQTTEKNIYTSYDQVPWYRKNWFIIVAALLFAPATLYSLFSGEIYYQKKGELVTYTKVVKVITIIICLMLSARIVALVFKD